jgi:hypothetical protein
MTVYFMNLGIAYDKEKKLKEQERVMQIREKVIRDRKRIQSLMGIAGSKGRYMVITLCI